MLYAFENYVMFENDIVKECSNHMEAIDQCIELPILLLSRKSQKLEGTNVIVWDNVKREELKRKFSGSVYFDKMKMSIDGKQYQLSKTIKEKNTPEYHTFWYK